jgi:hypothetical protein
MLVTGGDDRMKFAQAAPLAQMLFVVSSAKTAGILNGKFQ